MKKIKILAVSLIASGFLIIACQKEKVSPQNDLSNTTKKEVLNESNNQRNLNVTNPETVDNPYDFAGKYLFDVMQLTTKSNNPYLEIDKYMESKKLDMFDVNIQITNQESDLMLQYSSLVDNPNNINGKINIAQQFENRVVRDTRYNNEEKKRLLYLLSMTKYSYYFSALNDPAKEHNDYFIYILKKLNLDKVKDIEGGISPNDPVLRPVCVDLGTSGHAGTCVHKIWCRSHFLWWTWGDGWVIEEIVPCPGTGNQ